MGTRTAERTEFLGDIITTAVEGGTGYWAQTTQYQYVGSDGEIVVYCGERVGDETRAELKDEEDGTTGVLTLDTIAAAVGKLRRGEVKFYTSGAVFTAVCEGYSECDAGYIDADGADVIAQVAVLGEVVYG